MSTLAWEVRQAPLGEHLNAISVQWANRNELESQGDDGLAAGGDTGDEDSIFGPADWNP
jgi:hypothetical protein